MKQKQETQSRIFYIYGIILIDIACYVIYIHKWNIYHLTSGVLIFEFKINNWKINWNIYYFEIIGNEKCKLILSNETIIYTWATLNAAFDWNDGSIRYWHRLAHK